MFSKLRKYFLIILSLNTLAVSHKQITAQSIPSQDSATVSDIESNPKDLKIVGIIVGSTIGIAILPIIIIKFREIYYFLKTNDIDLATFKNYFKKHPLDSTLLMFVRSSIANEKAFDSWVFETIEAHAKQSGYELGKEEVALRTIMSSVEEQDLEPLLKYGFSDDQAAWHIASVMLGDEQNPANHDNPGDLDAEKALKEVTDELEQHVTDIIDALFASRASFIGKTEEELAPFRAKLTDITVRSINLYVQATRAGEDGTAGDVYDAVAAILAGAKAGQLPRDVALYQALKDNYDSIDTLLAEFSSQLGLSNLNSKSLIVMSLDNLAFEASFTKEELDGALTEVLHSFSSALARVKEIDPSVTADSFFAAFQKVMNYHINEYPDEFPVPIEVLSSLAEEVESLSSLRSAVSSLTDGHGDHGGGHPVDPSGYNPLDAAVLEDYVYQKQKAPSAEFEQAESFDHLDATTQRMLYAEAKAISKPDATVNEILEEANSIAYGDYYYTEGTHPDPPKAGPDGEYSFAHFSIFELGNLEGKFKNLPLDIQDKFFELSNIDTSNSSSWSSKDAQAYRAQAMAENEWRTEAGEFEGYHDGPEV